MEKKLLLVQAGVSPSVTPLGDVSEKDLMWDSQGDPGQGWCTVLQNLNLGRVFPAAPIRNELECFILVSDTFLSKHPWVPVMCN